MKKMLPLLLKRDTLGAAIRTSLNGLFFALKTNLWAQVKGSHYFTAIFHENGIIFSSHEMC